MEKTQIKQLVPNPKSQTCTEPVEVSQIQNGISCSPVWASLTMEHWQFLIQKQGDRSWHALESPNTEILEGRYRVLARSHRPNTVVEVRVTHSSTQEIPPKRRIQKRSRQTNAEGLMAVVPFTYFKPGVWELQCSGDLMSDILGKSWQYSVRLQVLPQSVNTTVNRVDEGGEGESLDYLDPHVTVRLATPLGQTINIIPDAISRDDTDLPAETLEDPVLDQPVNPVWLKGETAEQILHNLIELALPVAEPSPEEQTVADNSGVATPPPLLLTLEQATYMARWGETLTINGQVEAKSAVHGVEEQQRLYALELGIELRSPVASAILYQTQQSLPNNLLPFPITYSIDLPDCESKLILAEISLYGAFTDDDPVILLASQSFTITADVSELLAISAALQSSAANLEETSILATQEAAPSVVKLDLSLVNLVKSIKQDQSALVLSPASSKSLPPRIDSPSATRTSANRELQLPNLPPLPPVAIAAEEDLVATDLVTINTTSADISPQNEPTTAIDLGQLVISKRPTPRISSALPFLKRLPDASEPQEVATLDQPLHPHSPPSMNLPGDDYQYSAPQTATILSENEDTDLPAVEESVAELPPISPPASQAITFNSELIIQGNPNSSPLIRKWLQSQGYILPEPISLPDQEYDSYVPPQPTLFTNQIPLPPASQLPVVEDLPPAIAPEETLPEIDPIEPEENPESPTPEITPPATDEQPENPGKLATVSHRPIPPLPPLHRPQPQPAWLLQEIVVDDADSDNETDVNHSSTPEVEPQVDVATPETSSEVNHQPLPIPQMYVPEGELISGTSVTIRLVVPNTRPQMAIKFWVEDCQTRYILDRPEVLKNLLPTAGGGGEVITQLTIPFGCLEIRLGAIALDLVSEQESDKVTLVRAVVPPDLPALQLDELLGI